MATTSWFPAGLCANYTTGSGGSLSWVTDDSSNPLSGSECTTDDNTFAGTFDSSSGTTHFLKCTNFGISALDVPSGATIDGIELRFSRYRSGIVVNNTVVKFVKAGAVVGNDIGASGDWPTSESSATYGSASELGGQSWNDTDVTATDFGCVFQIVFVPSRGSSFFRTTFVDIVEMRIHYTGGGPPPTPGATLEWFAVAGGGGASHAAPANTPGSGGSGGGGGGNTTSNGNGVSGTANTGGGGGGARYETGGTPVGGAGGSGIVGFRYLIADGIVATGGTETDDGTYKVHLFTSNGTLVITDEGTGSGSSFTTTQSSVFLVFMT